MPKTKWDGAEEPIINNYDAHGIGLDENIMSYDYIHVDGYLH